TPRTMAVPAFLVLALLTAAAIGVNRRSPRLFEILVAGAAFALALKARRNLPIFAIAAAPILLRNAAAAWSGRGATAPAVAGGATGESSRAGGRRAFVPALLLAAAASALTVDVASNRFFLRAPTERWFGLGEIPHYFPDEAAAFVERSRLPGQVFHPLGIGGYLIHAWGGDRRVFIDGRNDPYLHGVLETYLAAVADPAAFEDLVRKYQVTTVLWPHEWALEGRALLKRLSEGHGWTLAHLDAGAAVYVRDDVAGPMTAAGSMPPLGVSPEDRLNVLRQQLAQRPFAGPPIREIALAHYLGIVGDAAGAESFLRGAIATIPGSAPLRHDLGLALERQGRRDEALAAYRAAAAIDPRFAPAQSALASLALEKGDLDEAGRRAADAWRLGDRSARTFATRARLFEQQGKQPEAEAIWDEAVRTVPGHTGLLLGAARAHARRGDAYGAALLYEQILRRSPDDPVAQQERSALGAVTTPTGR
ncbi:MAG TPA: tetratricopeptide repeat protein, partial [Dongiaceae bacterium]|nr:tetratricopeptide repeat protein [Dongiaceae bacterium]